jgi:hypothetical protein
MTHMLGDVAQPTHTDQDEDEAAVHSGYEKDVDARCTTGSHRYRARNDWVDRVGPSRRTRALARQSHESYRSLLRAYVRGGYTAKVDRITRRQLNQAANAVADLIRVL